jgi:hypothetical protein
MEILSYQLKFHTNLSSCFISICNGNKVKLHIRHDLLNDMYFIDVDILKNGEYKNIISGINMVVGSNLFMQFAYYNLGNFYIIPYMKEDYDKIPSSETLVNNFFAIWEHN